jgi:hypothetical protein
MGKMRARSILTFGSEHLPGGESDPTEAYRLTGV